MTDPQKRPLVVGLGEALVDCFPDRQMLGGAPINFAVHAATLLAARGGQAAVATRVGSDALGDRLVAELGGRGVGTRAIQRDSQRPTGRVDIATDTSGEPRYTFLPDSAWDAFECGETWKELADECDAVVFGTLAQRAVVSREAIHEFLTRATAALRLLDVNLRQDFFSSGVLNDSFRLADAVKLNEKELEIVAGELGATGPESLVEEYGLRWLVVTRGAEGMIRYDANGNRQTAPPAPFTPQPAADPVGAGDACCACLVCGELLGLPIEETLRLAADLGSYVAERPGATPPHPAGFGMTPGP